MLGLVFSFGCATASVATGSHVDGGLQADVASAPPTDVGVTDSLVMAIPPEDVVRAQGDAGGATVDAGSSDAGTVLACSAFSGERNTTLYALGAAGNLTSIVWNGTDYAFTWNVLESSSPVLFGLYFGRADRDGELVPGSFHRIFAADRHETQGALAVGGDGGGLAYLDLPRDGLTVGMRAYFARLDRNGVLIAGSERRLSAEHPPHQAVAITYSAPLRQWAVAWQGQVALGGGNVETHAYLSRIDASGAILQPNAVQLDSLRSTTEPYLAPSLVWARDRYAIALTEYVQIPNARVVIAEVDPTAATVTRRIVVREGGRPLRVALATDGTMYGAAWMQLGLDTPTANAVWFRRAAVGGDALGTAVELSGGRESGEPAVLFDGDTFRVAFYRRDADGGSVWRARFARDGSVVGTPGQRFSTGTPFSAFPLLASDGCNEAIGWTATSGVSPQTTVVRLHLRAAAAE